MTKGRVAVLYVNSLFGEGLAQLLHDEQDLTVMLLRAEPGRAAQEIRRLKPHVIIVEESGDEGSVRDLLRDLPPSLLIRVRLQDNVMDVYYNRQVVSACPEDLIEAIHLGVSRGAGEFMHG